MFAARAAATSVDWCLPISPQDSDSDSDIYPFDLGYLIALAPKQQGATSESTVTETKEGGEGGVKRGAALFTFFWASFFFSACSFYIGHSQSGMREEVWDIIYIGMGWARS